MRRRGLAVALAAALTLQGSLGPAAPQQTLPRFGIDVERVSVAVVVRDKNGALVRGLTRDDFIVLEDDKPQAIQTFAFEEVPVGPAPAAAETAETAEAPPPAVLRVPPPAPVQPAPAPTPAPAGSDFAAGHRLVVLLFDLSSMQPDQIEHALDSARAYVRTRMSPADLVGVATIDSGLRVEQDFTADRAQLGRVLDGLSTTTGSDAEDMSAAVSDSTDTDTSGDAFNPDTSEVDLFSTDQRMRAIQTLSDMLAPLRQKKSIVYFSAGTRTSGVDNQVELRAAIDRAVKANVAIYPVDTRGLQAVVPGGEASRASASGTSAFSGRGVQQQFDQQIASQETLSELAGSTGGRAFLDTNDFGTVYERVLTDTAAYYVIGYESTNPARDGKFRRIKVRVKQADLRVEHRSGYYAGKDFGHSSHEDREHQLQDQLESDLPSRDIPVWLQSAYFRVADDRFYVPVSVAVPGAAIPLNRGGGRDRAGLDVIGVVRDEAKRAVARIRDTVQVEAEASQEVGRKNVQYQTGLTLPPGRYRLKVVVRENQAGSFGSFESELFVPDLRKSPVKVSSVVFGTQLQPTGRRGPNPLAREGTELVPSTTHVVTTRQPVYFYYEVYDPARTPAGDVRLLTSISFFRGKLRRYETPLVESKAMTNPDRKAVVFQFSLPAGSLKPGLYACQVNVIDDAAGTFTFPRVGLFVR
jgi:VWFA-related protein